MDFPKEWQGKGFVAVSEGGVAVNQGLLTPSGKVRWYNPL